MAAIAAEAAVTMEAGPDSPEPGIVALEAATLSAWPAIKSAYDGRWLWRYARGLSKRSNSIQCLDAADDGEVALRLARLSELSEVHRIAPLFRVTPLAGPGVVAVLDQQGWVPFEECRVLSRPLSEEVETPLVPVRQYNIADPDWFLTQAEMSGYLPATTAILREVLLLVPHEARGLLAIGADGVPAAAGMVVNAGGIAVFLNIVTAPMQRRKGFARAIMQAGLGWARFDGAEWAVLQVIADNAPAEALYASLGFAESYRYHYRRRPE